MSAPDPFATYDAAYVLGALSPHDQSAYEAHLRECDACARSVRELAGMPGLLAQAQALPPTQRDEQPPAELLPAKLLPALLGRVARQRRRRRRLTALTAGLSLAACLALVSVLLPPNDPGPGNEGSSGPSETIAMTSLVDYPVEATVSLEDADWGTLVEMDCSYGIEDPNEYVLVAITQDGERRELASWFTVPDYPISMSVGTQLRREDIESLEVRSTHGYPVLRTDVPGDSGSL